jgi:O-antigen/teichoic acid export membrane protein
VHETPPMTSAPPTINQAIRWSMFGSVGRSLVQLLQFLALSRLLAPTDFGSMAIVGPYVLVMGILSDPGLTSSLLHERNVSPNARASLFWIGLLWSSFIAVLMALLSTPLSFLYGQPEIAGLIFACAPSLPLLFTARQVEVMAERSLRFRGVVLSETLASIAGAAVGIGTAFQAPGPLALAIPITATAAVRAVIAWLFLSVGWRPSPRFRLSETFPFLRYGLPLSVSVGVGHVAASLDLIIGGALLSPAELGRYSVPRQLILYVIASLSSIINRVTVPAIAAIRDNPEVTARAEASARQMMTLVLFPIMGCIAFQPTLAARLALGPEWESAAGILGVLSVWGFFKLNATFDQSMLAALGRVYPLAVWNSLIAACIAFPLVFASRFGPDGLAWASMLCIAISTPLMWSFMLWDRRRKSMRGYLESQLRPLLHFAAGVGIASILPIGNSATAAIVRIVIAAAIYCGLSFRHAPETYHRVLSMLPIRSRT